MQPNFLASIDERIHPIAVLEFRRQFRLLGVAAAFGNALMFAVFTLGILFAKEVQHPSLYTVRTFESALFLYMYLHCTLRIISGFGAGYYFSRCDCVLLLPFSRKEQIRGLQQLAFLDTTRFVCSTLPIFAFLYAMNVYSLIAALSIPLLFWIFAQLYRFIFLVFYTVFKHFVWQTLIFLNAVFATLFFGIVFFLGVNFSQHRRVMRMFVREISEPFLTSVVPWILLGAFFFLAAYLHKRIVDYNIGIAVL